MKRFLLGIALFLMGGISGAVLLAGAMQPAAQGAGTVYSVWMTLNQYRMIPLTGVLGLIMVIGLLIALRELIRGE